MLTHLRREACGVRYDAKQVNDRRLQLEDLRVDLLQHSILATETLLGSSFSKLPAFSVFRSVPAFWCPQMVKIPAGTFMMGSPEDEEGRGDEETPQHEVKIAKLFALGRYAVTFEEYHYFCDETGRKKPDGRGARGRRPVINISHDDAVAYCVWLGEVSEHAYRLPSEAEWEYACRAGTTTPFSFGETITTDQVNYDGRSPYGGGERGIYRGEAIPAGSLPANGWGLHEMHGNAWEWVEDLYNASYEGAPTDGSAWFSSPSGIRVVRGGSCAGGARLARAAYRDRPVPGERADLIGFRCARAQA